MSFQIRSAVEDGSKKARVALDSPWTHPHISPKLPGRPGVRLPLRRPHNFLDGKSRGSIDGGPRTGGTKWRILRVIRQWVALSVGSSPILFRQDDPSLIVDPEFRVNMHSSTP